MTDENSAPSSDMDVIADDAATGGDEHMIPKSRLDEEIGKHRATKEQMEQLAEKFEAEVPERFRGLIPNLSPADKVGWIMEAQKSGLFNKQQTVPDTDNSKPKTTPKASDFSDMPVQAKLAAGYNK